jgi:predicted nucleic acid-binding protein
MKIYLDNCSYNRPFDDQDKMKIRLETAAKLYIQNEIKNGTYELVWSFMNDIENGDNIYDDKRESIQKWENIARYNCNASIDILQKGKEIEVLGADPKDALHIACAIKSECDYFITTDGRLIKKLSKKEIGRIKIINPIDFIRETGEDNEE